MHSCKSTHESHILLFAVKDSLLRIKKLHKIHEKLATMNTSTPGLTKDDPFLLMHSIKSIDNYNGREESNLVDEWFDRLHAFVIDPSNNLDESTEDSESDNGDKEAIDLTGTYTSIIRGYSKANAAEKASRALKRMQELSEFNSISATSGINSIASVDLKVNAYNLVLGYYNAKDDSLVLKKLSMLDTMIAAARNADSASPVPIPNDQSFTSCIKALATLADPVKAMEESDRITAAFESLVKNNIVSPSTKVHNSNIDLYINLFSGRDSPSSVGSLLSICTGVVNRMERLAPLYPGISPDKSTLTLLLKACSVNDGSSENRLQRMDRAEQIFQDLSGAGAGEESKLTDKCYFHMMKCVSNNIGDPEEKKTKIMHLFSQASGAGLVSADVLKMLRTNITNEEYTQIAGNGRLADKWIANVTSGLALYTDGTAGGAGKNARRQGKSTSNWSKKQRERDESMQNRKQAKTEKKLLKRERERKASPRRRETT